MTVCVLYTKSTGLQFDLEERHLDIVRNSLPDADVFLAETPQEMTDRGIDPDILITWVTGSGHFTPVEFCCRSKNLKWIHGLSAGIEGLAQSPVAKRPGLRVTNSKGTHGVPISEHVMALMLYHSRGLNRIKENQKRVVWERFIPEELCGKTLTILGMGAIASEVAKRAKAFDMHVIGVKRSVKPLPNVDEVLSNSEMDEAIARADFCLMLLPATTETKGIMDDRKFGLMKPGSYFINAGRGSTLDTDALVRALQSGRLSGAALDAMEPEPLPADHPLWTMENVTISPHMASESPMYLDRAFNIFAKNVPYFLAGEPMPTEVDLIRQY